MSQPEKILLNIQSDFEAKLNSEAYFADIAINSLRRMVIAKEMVKEAADLTAKGGKVGCGVLIYMPTLDGIHPNLAGPQLEVWVPIDVIEIPEINFGDIGSQKTAEEVALRIARTLCALEIEGLAFFTGDKNLLAPLEDQYGAGTNSYRVMLHAILYQAEEAKVIKPELTDAALTVTLSSPTAGAAIYYTTDDSFPGPGNAAAHLYAAPFLVASGAIVRFAGYRAGMIGSDVGRGRIT